IEEESKKVVLGVEKGSQDEGQDGPDPNAQAEARRDQTLVLKLKARLDQTLMKPLKARLGQTLMKHLKARQDQTLVMLKLEDFTFGDQFLCDKPSDADKNAEIKVESMVNVPIQQAMSFISLMTSPIIDLTSRH
nr:hypothetical protein [Tanacetum cinerariifolium]